MLVDDQKFRSLKGSILIFKRNLIRKKGVFLRIFAAWLIGMLFLLIDQQNDFDLRLKFRPAQDKNESIVLVLLPRQEWARLQGQKINYFRPLRESAFISDAFFWDTEIWKRLLERVLQDEPSVVGVGFYFGQNISQPKNSDLNQFPFKDPRLVWSAQLSPEFRVLPSRMNKTNSPHVGLNSIQPDKDGIVRRFSSTENIIPHFSAQIAKKHNGLEQQPISSLINFRGRANTFQTVTAEKVLNYQVPSTFFKNKIVLIGGLDSEGQIYQTPLGPMSKSEILANVIDNHLEVRWPQKLNAMQSAVLLLLFVLFAAAITSYYPQSLALFTLVFSMTLYSVASIWLFDRLYFWLPVFAVVVTVFATTVIFISLQLTVKEYVNLQLEKEHQFLISVEELKNNFLSLISHDLKTPIAKIQAICDRMLVDSKNEAHNSDLLALRNEATELHRYIQTLLQITRVESRDFRITKEASDINELIENALEKLQPIAKQKKIALLAELEPMFLVEVDSILIGEVILNLIENAIQYTPEGGRVNVTSRDVDGDILFMVEDNGPGIPPAEQKHIFEKFFRGELGKTKPKGSGLGLYLVKYFIELHKGQVFLESQLNQGTKVGFRLPNHTLDADIGDNNVVA